MVRKVKGNKMAKERVITKFLILCLVSFLFPSGIKAAVHSDSVTISNATGYLGLPYEWGSPSNKETEYGGLGIMDIDFREGMDCSGLICLCANLRRHYFVRTGDIDLYTDSISWENLQAGDLLLSSSSVLIFEKWIQKEGTNTNAWKVGIIHASFTKQQVRRDTFTVTSCINEGWSPCHFKNDTTPPKIKFSGAGNEKHYAHNVTLTVKGNDDVEGPTYAYGLYKDKKFKTKTFTEQGKYEIHGKAIDWKKNKKDGTITFYIWTPPILEEVAMWTSESGLTYQARWEKTSEGTYSLNVLYRGEQPIDSGSITVACIFSAPMNTTQNPLVMLYCGGSDTLIADKNAYWSNETTFVGSTEKMPKGYEYIVNLGVSEAEDILGNPLDVRPDVHGLQKGNDTNHKKVLSISIIKDTNIKVDPKKALFHIIMLILILIFIFILFFIFIFIYIRFILGIGRD